MSNQEIPNIDGQDGKTKELNKVKSPERITPEQTREAGDLLTKLLDTYAGASVPIDFESFKSLLKFGLDDPLWSEILRLFARRVELQNSIPIPMEFELGEGEKIKVFLHRLVPYLLDSEIEDFYRTRGIEPISLELLTKIHTADPNLRTKYNTITHSRGIDGKWYVSIPFRPWDGRPDKLVHVGHDSIEFDPKEENLFLVGVEPKK